MGCGMQGLYYEASKDKAQQMSGLGKVLQVYQGLRLQLLDH